MMDDKRLPSIAILDMIDWLDRENNQSDFERGVIYGLKIAQQIASEVEQNE